MFGKTVDEGDIVVVILIEVPEVRLLVFGRDVNHRKGKILKSLTD